MHCDSDWITFELTTSLLSIFDICWVSAAVVLVKNVLLLVPTGKVREFDFPKYFLIKARWSVEKFLHVEKLWDTARHLGAYPAWLLNSTISKFWHSTNMVITLHNSKILISLLLLSHPTILNVYQTASWNFFGLVIPLKYNYYY